MLARMSNQRALPLLALLLAGGCLSGRDRVIDGGPLPDAGVRGDAEPPEADGGTDASVDWPDADVPSCDLEDRRFEGTFEELEPTRESGRLEIHFDPWSTAYRPGPCDGLGGAALPGGTWSQAWRHGRAAVVQSRQNGAALCVSVATAGPELLYEGTISADCAHMSGSFSGTDDDGTAIRGTWTASLVP
jgi:hypothetical protein